MNDKSVPVYTDVYYGRTMTSSKMEVSEAWAKERPVSLHMILADFIKYANDHGLRVMKRTEFDGSIIFDMVRG